MSTLDVVVGLGSNVGDRLSHLRLAVHHLAALFEVRARSSVYETAPVGPPQPDYLNAAVRLRAAGSADELLATLLAIEQRDGRVRTPATRWGPRTIDLDVLWVDGLMLASPTLTVPHPRLIERAFALVPLHDVAPDAIDPLTRQRFPAPPPDDGLRRTTFVL